jgi:ribonucleotide reductase alpha subunit
MGVLRVDHPDIMEFVEAKLPQGSGGGSVSAFQNFNLSVSVRRFADIYWQAWHMRLKGITVFRYGSKGQHVLELGLGETPQQYEHFARCDPHACKL